MATSTHYTPTDSKSEACSDLVTIRGIGATKKRWLESMGIYTIADLANASADEIELQLRNNGRNVPKNEIEGWIAQAQALNSNVSDQSTKSCLNSDPVNSINSIETIDSEEECVYCFDGICDAMQQGEELSTEPVKETSEELNVPWNTIASFTIEHQTRQFAEQTEQRTIVRHTQTDAVETWTGSDTESIQRWMDDRIKASLLQTTAESAIVPEITQLRLLQLGQTGRVMIANTTCPFFADAIKTNVPFAMEVSMHLTGLTTTPLIQHIAYRIQCTARNLSTGVVVHLGDAIANVSLNENSSCQVLFPELLFQQPGIYRLKIAVSLQNVSTEMSCFKVPMLQVV